MKEDIVFDFEKFNSDLEKRENEFNSSRSFNEQNEIDLDINRRKRNELYQEKWQNRIKWNIEGK